MSIIETVLSILAALLVFGVIITVHEFGHFITAKLFGVRVNEFSVGMGPKLFGWGKGETKYSLRALPIGGYCAMEGENGGEEEDPRAFYGKPKWQRGIILVAGAAMNLLLGFLLMFGLTVARPLLSTTYVCDFAETAASNRPTDGGDALMPLDEILKVNNVSTHVDMDLSFALMTDEDGIVDITVRRDGEIVRLHNVSFNTTTEDGHTYTCIDFSLYGHDNALTHLFDTKGASVPKHIGNCFVSLGRTFRETWYSVGSTVRMIWVSLFDMVTGKYSLKDLSGPVGTTSVIAEAARMSFDSLLLIAMFITINLGIMNLLPFPALDGGRVALLLLEAVRGKPLKPETEGIINLIGFALLLGLIAVVTVSDILKFF